MMVPQMEPVADATMLTMARRMALAKAAITPMMVPQMEPAEDGITLTMARRMALAKVAITPSMVQRMALAADGITLAPAQRMERAVNGADAAAMLEMNRPHASLVEAVELPPARP
jgi:hypothetical protein